MKHPILPRGGELRLPVVSGLLLTLSFPPFHLLIPSFLALIPYILFLSRLSEEPSGGSAFRGSFWLGVVYYGTLLYWLFTALVFYTWLALLGYLITVVVLSVFLGVVGWAACRLRAERSVPLWASLPVLWTAMEWLRGHLGDLSFPWLGLGHSLTGYPALIGFAEVVGARGITFWLVAINVLLADWWMEGLGARWRRRSIALAALIVIPVSFSVLRWTTIETRPAARALVVQPNIPEDLKLDREVAVDTSQQALGNLTRRGLEEDSEIDLVAWPETALPVRLDLAREWAPWAAGLARRYDVGLVYGLVDLDIYSDGSYDYYNAALFLDEGGAIQGVYRKHHLVPVVERVPYLPLAWVRAARRSASEGWRLPIIGDVGRFLAYFGGFGRGTSEPVFRLDNGSGFGVLICYESAFANLSRTYRRNGADFLVNLTNDAWYGREEPIWSRTSALYQHPSHLVMRAIENRVGVARAANTGISMFVDPMGRVYEATDLFEPDSRSAVVLTTGVSTLYTRVGDWVGWTAAILSAATLAVLWWNRRRRGRGGVGE